MKVHLIYFSATHTTQTVCRGVAQHWGKEIVEHDLTLEGPAGEVELSEDDLLVLGMPVYCGRIPELATERLASFRGHSSKAIAIAVYGNREYDDALIEMAQWLEAHNFHMVAAAAFIGRHCIFPAVADGRPDAADEGKMKDFAEACRPLLEVPVDAIPRVAVPGNAELPPYKRSSFCPVPTDQCTQCGTCAANCPAGAISPEDASVVDASRCLACGRCIVICPVGGRQFAGEAYEQASLRFTAAYSARKEPVFFLPEM